MDTIVFLLYAVIFACIWYVFNQYFKDHSKEMRQPIRVNVGAELQKWKEHFLGHNNKDLSVPNIKNMIQKAMGQISEEETNSMKPKVEATKTIETDMEMYLIGNKDAFFKNVQESRNNPTLVKTNKRNLDINSYFGTNKKESNTIVSML
jgi:hypothetical protein